MSKLFGGEQAVMECALKNPNQFRDAVLYETLNTLPGDKINEFIDSEEAGAMVSTGKMSPQVIDKLHDEHCNHHGYKPCVFKAAVCKLAKDNDDEDWKTLVALRMQERSVFNKLVEKYGDAAKADAEVAQKEIIEACIPEYFRA